MPRQSLVLVGAGTLAQSLSEGLQRSRGYRVAAFLVDERFLPSVSKHLCAPVFPLDLSALRHLPPRRHVAFVAVGPGEMSLSRQRLVDRVRGLGYRLTSIVSDSAVAPKTAIGENVYVAPGAQIALDAKIGDGVFVHENAVIASNAIVEPYAYIGPGALVGSFARIGNRAVLGIGAVVKTSTSVGPASLIGAGCYISRDVPAQSLVVRKADAPVSTFAPSLMAKFLDDSGDAT